MKDGFDPEVAAELALRIRTLTPDSRPLWGKMDAAQMLAHCCVPYELAFGEGGHPTPGALRRFLLRHLVKPGVVGPKPYRKGLPTAPEFRIRGERSFEVERDRLVAYLHRTAEMGRASFEGRVQPNFGPLTAEEWNGLFLKHLEHHLRQFGVAEDGSSGSSTPDAPPPNEGGPTW